jgi:hypothetical protein
MRYGEFRSAAFALKKRISPTLTVLGLCSSLLAGTFVIQACASGPTANPNSPATAPLLCTQDANCFRQSIDANHVVLPAGTTTEQAYAKYKSCMLQNDKIIGPFVLGGSDAEPVQQGCFSRVQQ